MPKNVPALIRRGARAVPFACAVPVRSARMRIMAVLGGICPARTPNDDGKVSAAF